MRLPSAVLVAALIGASIPAQAQQCPPLQRAFALDLIPAGSRYAVPVTVNGQAKRFMLHTAEFTSILSQATVTELKLSPRTEGLILYFDGSTRTGHLVTVDLQIGPVKANGQEMYILDGTGSFDGFFSANLMQNYDIDFDFAGRKLSYFLTDHCEGRVVHWTKGAFTVVPFDGWVSGSGRDLTIPVTIDGHEIRAWIDTSLAQTVIDADSVNSMFGVTGDSPGAAKLDALPNGRAIFNWTFKELKIGAITISDPRMRVEPDLVAVAGSKSRVMLQSDSRVQHLTDHFLPSMRLGLDVLRQLHIYLAARENKLYLSPN
jgi:hypothetical protein